MLRKLSGTRFGMTVKGLPLLIQVDHNFGVRESLLYLVNDLLFLLSRLLLKTLIVIVVVAEF